MSVGGETFSGPIDVEVSQEADDVTISFSPVGSRIQHSAEFQLAAAQLDTLAGDVQAEVGSVFAGEGSEYGYIRIIDELGVWFEGGRSSSIDGSSEGGFAIDGPFALGIAVGEPCQISEGRDATPHSVVAVLDNERRTRVDEIGIDGVWHDVNVRVVGLSASKGTFDVTGYVADGYPAGRHQQTEIVGYLYRTAP